LIPPPRGNGMQRKFRSVVRYAHVDITFVFGDVVDSERDRSTYGNPREIMFVDFFRLSAPCPALVSKFTNQFLFFFMEFHSAFLSVPANRAIFPATFAQKVR